MPRSLLALPLTQEAYSPYGNVLMVASPSASQDGRIVNQGTARRFDWLSPLVNLRPEARLNILAARVTPREERPLQVRLLERHSYSTQIFIPMNARRYLVVVALPQGPAGPPDLATLAAFVATATQGIAYHPGTWHHPLIGLDAEADYISLVHEDGSATDCEEYPYADADQVTIEIPA